MELKQPILLNLAKGASARVRPGAEVAIEEEWEEGRAETAES
jgi:hypothetical protein